MITSTTARITVYYMSDKIYNNIRHRYMIKIYDNIFSKIKKQCSSDISVLVRADGSQQLLTVGFP